MKTLYLSDLDGTLLRSDERVSEYTARVINRFVESGGCFSYATARSLVTAVKATVGLTAKFPVICYNGAFTFENGTGKIIASHFFAREEAKTIIEVLTRLKISPIVYAFIDGKECFSFIPTDANAGTQFFLDSRLGDPRRRGVSNREELFRGEIFYFSCIGGEERLAAANEILRTDARVKCIYSTDIYSGEQWLELLPAKATKAAAALDLKNLLNYYRLVVFGDGRNDLDLFAVADESYATANAVPELKKIATGIIGSNDDDGVAKWIEANV